MSEAPFWLVEPGLMAYGEALELQRRVVAAKKAGTLTLDVILLLEHPAVLTLGRRGKLDNIRASEADLAALGIPTYTVERGGDVTYHGPGQLVGYPILDLNHFRRDVGWFVETMQRAVQETVRQYGIESYPLKGEHAGLWVRGEGERESKIMAQGVRIERWITFHGFALNVNTNLAHFDLIVPCGIAAPDKGVTSMANEGGAPLPFAMVQAEVAAQLQRGYGRAAEPHPLSELLALLPPLEALAAAPHH